MIDLMEKSNWQHLQDRPIHAQHVHVCLALKSEDKKEDALKVLLHKTISLPHCLVFVFDVVSVTVFVFVS